MASPEEVKFQLLNQAKKGIKVAPDDLKATTLSISLNDAVEYKKKMLMKRWTILKSPSPKLFLTSDNPIIFSVHEKNSEFLFPISPHLLMYIHSRADFESSPFWNITPKDVITFNIQAINFAERYVFCSKKEQAVWVINALK